jgi:amino acid adenylation domain-containing protein
VVNWSGSVPALFEAQVARRPAAYALVAQGVEWSYAELNRRANRLAHALTTLGVGPERVVAVLLPLGPDFVIAALAALKAGAAYAPVDPAYPAQRIAMMLRDSRPQAVLTTRAGAPEVAGGADVVLVDEPQTVRRLSLQPETDHTDRTRTAPLRPASLAYLVYTSGSTGLPKAAAVQHRSLVNHVAWAGKTFGGTGRRILLHTSVSFDLTMTCLYAPLVSGGTLVLADLRAVDPAAEPTLVRRFPPQFTKATPSHLSLLRELPPEYSPTEELMLGGEPLHAEVLRDWRARHPGIALVNAYGPTETTVNSSYHRIAPEDPIPDGQVPIGNATPGALLYVLDARLRPVPVGVPGELYIAGTGLARGYWHHPTLTAERFVADAFGPAGTRMYRTGDLVRWTPTGTLDFLGRTDHQIKIRGHRVEPGEIETTLAQHPGVSQTTVTLDHTSTNPRLVAYVVPADGASVSADQLRQALRRQLPGHMVPAAIVTMDRLPLTPNGKVDRAALPVPAAVSGPAGRPPTNPREELLCAVFADLLGVARVGVDDNFFDLGGHSLLATRLVNRVRRALGVELPIRAVFETPTPAGLARQLEMGGTPRPPVRPSAAAGPKVLSDAQRRMWFLYEMQGCSATYNLPIALRLTGELDPAALRLAVGDVVDRHESLRTVVPHVAGEPRPSVRPAGQVELPWTFAELAVDGLDAALRSAARYGFDLAFEVPARVSLFRTGPADHTLLLLLHHIAGDGWSFGPLMRDLATAYQARLAGAAPAWAPLPVQYADYVRWQRILLGDEDAAESLVSRQTAFWMTRLAGLPTRVSLPVTRPHAVAPPSYRGERITFAIDAELHRAVSALAARSGATVFMVLQSALAILLTRLGAGTDIPLGYPVSGRTDEALNDLIGLLVNTLVLRVDTGGDPSGTQVIERVREASLAGYAHQDVPFDYLVKRINPDRAADHHPFFQVMLAPHDATSTDPTVADHTLAGITCTPVPVDLGVARFDLTILFTPRYDAQGRPDGIEGHADFAVDLFDRPTVDTAVRRWIRLLLELVADPDRPIGRYPLLSADELTRHTTAAEPAPPPVTVPRLLESRVARHPDAIAIEHNGQTISYTELNARANRFAHGLISLGIGPGNLVAVLLPRSIEQVTAILGITKSGAGYVPIDPAYPAATVATLLADARPSTVVINRETADRLPDRGAAHRLFADDAAAWDHRDTDPSDEDRTVPLRPSNVAYVIYTSGSTGVPKAVAVPHTGIAALTATTADRLGLGRGARVLQAAAIGFDAAVWELVMTFAVGGTLVVPPGLLVGDDLRDALAELAISHVQMPPSVLGTLPPDAPATLPGLATVTVGGEACPAELVARWAPGHRMINVYGPTETTVCVTISDPLVNDGGAPTIGRPVAGARIYLLDDGLQPVPDGVAGEVYIAGPCLALGYLNRPGLTAERFVADPFGPAGERMYRTGDIARRAWGGKLEFLGRVDTQVKIRGFRIEPGEVEHALSQHPTVAQCVVVAREDRPSDQRLVGYVISRHGADPVNPDRLREYLRQRLPDHLVPATVVALDALPLTPNGKVDRAALPIPRYARTAPRRAPGSARETVLCELFAEVLGVPEVGVEDGFFDLGGHSLLATRLASKVRTALGVDLPVAALFEARTPAALARRIGSSVTSVVGATDVLLPLRVDGGRATLFCVHPAAGFGWPYARLLPYLDAEISVYGLQARALRANQEAARSVEEMADDYLAQIAAVSPTGPYHLLGWSFGGLVVHAIAARLRSRGERVDLLAMLDSYPARELDAERREAGDRPEAYRDLLEMLDIPLPPELADRLTDQRFRAALGASPALAGLDPELVEALPRVVLGNIELGLAYRPPHLSGPAVLVEARHAAGRRDLRGAWRPYLAGPVECYSVSCSHYRMFDPLSLRQIGPIVARHMPR